MATSASQTAGPSTVRRVLRVIGLLAGALLLVALSGVGYLYWWLSHPSDDPQPLPSALIGGTTPEGVKLLENASARADHATLSKAFQRQQKGSWCGVASAVIALRALDIAPSLTQDRFFNEDATRVRSKLAVTFGGMHVGELGRLLEAHGARAQVVHASDTTLEKFRAAAAKNLATTGNVLLVNYSRAHLEQGSSGHISPVAAHDAKSDRMLVLDTAAYKWPPTWIATKDLFDAMNTVDSASGKTRGYVEVSPPSR